MYIREVLQINILIMYSVKLRLVVIMLWRYQKCFFTGHGHLLCGPKSELLTLLIAIMIPIRMNIIWFFTNQKKHDLVSFGDKLSFFLFNPCEERFSVQDSQNISQIS